MQNTIKEGKDKYMLVRVADNIHRVVKVLAEYDNDTDAARSMTDLLTGDTAERDLLEKFTGTDFSREVYAGQAGNRINVLEATLECIRADILETMFDPALLEKAAREAVKKINSLVDFRKIELNR